MNGKLERVSGRILPETLFSCADVEQFRCAIVQLPAGKPARKLASVAEAKLKLTSASAKPGAT